ncbi:hypothetical protein D5W64_12730 [Salmonella enterica subsp. enterica serovar Saintpaul]|nr:hypothetical protein [Salmonella enterica subsp. enterica serovar Saintpaul]
MSVDKVVYPLGTIDSIKIEKQTEVPDWREERQATVKLHSDLHKARVQLGNEDSIEGKLDVLEAWGSFNRSKFNNLSKRRQKLFLRRFYKYDTRTGKLVYSPDFKRNKYYLDVPFMVTWVEQVSKAETDMMAEWMRYIAEDYNKG